MPRIRTIKPEFWDSPGTARASLRARLFFIALWNWADDYGVGTANAKQLIGFAFPNDDDVSVADFPCLRTEVATCYDVAFYEVDGRHYFAIPSWEKHQKNERRAQGKHPGPDKAERFISDTHGTSAQTHGSSGPGTGEQGNRGTGEQGNSNNTLTGVIGDAPEQPKSKRGSRLDPDFIPTDESRTKILSEHPGLDLRREHAKFVDYWTDQPGAKGVRVSWDGTWRNWMRKAADDLARNGINGKSRRQQETDSIFEAAMTRARAADAAEAAGQPIEGVIL